ASLGPKLLFVLVVVLSDLGFGWRADSRLLRISERGYCEVSPHLVAMIGFGQTRLLQFFLVLLLGEPRLLFSLLDLLVHLVVVRDEVFFLRLLKEGLLLDKGIQDAQARGNQLAGIQRGAASALIELLFYNGVDLLHRNVARPNPCHVFIVFVGAGAAARKGKS